MPNRIIGSLQYCSRLANPLFYRLLRIFQGRLSSLGLAYILGTDRVTQGVYGDVKVRCHGHRTDEVLP
jgi:hypothetical protein